MNLNHHAVRRRIAESEALGPTLCRRVVPLFQDSERSPGKPEHVGSGFFVQADHHHFVVSAAHVLRHRTAQSAPITYSLGANEMRVLNGAWRLSRAEPGRQDIYDVGVVALDHRPPYEALGRHPLQLAELLEAHGSTERTHYMMVGYPTSQVDRPEPRTLSAQPYSYRNIGASPATYRAVKREPATHILTVFKKRAVGRDGCVQMFPNPQGMSGSPLWLLHPALSFPRVVGIATRWSKQHHVIVSTGIGAALLLIEGLLAGHA